MSNNGNPQPAVNLNFTPDDNFLIIVNKGGTGELKVMQNPNQRDVDTLALAVGALESIVSKMLQEAPEKSRIIKSLDGLKPVG